MKLMSESDIKTVRDVLALPSAQQSVMEEFSKTEIIKTPITLLHKMFEKAAQDNADKTALIAADNVYTYKELNEKANIVAKTPLNF